MQSLASVKRPLYVGAASAGKMLGVGRLRGLPDKQGTLRVLMYHKITGAAPNTIAVHPDSFQNQQQHLAERYKVVTLQQVRDHIAGVQPLPPRAVLLTFDDGYRDNLTSAYPILKEFGHTAAIFPALDFLEGGVLPHDKHLQTENPTLSWSELQSMQDVFDVGSHACSHRPLTSLPLDEAVEEIERSKEALERKLEKRVFAFSYPKGSIGDFNDDLEAAVQKAGYEIAFTTLPGTNLPPMNPLRLRRHNVEDFGPRFFSSLLDGTADVLALKDTRFGYSAKSKLRKLLRADHG